MNRNAIAALWLIAGEAAALGGEATSRNLNAAASAVLLGLGDRKGQLLYRWSVKVVISDTVRWKSSFVQPDGTLAAEDELFLHGGAFRGTGTSVGPPENGRRFGFAAATSSSDGSCPEKTRASVRSRLKTGSSPVRTSGCTLSSTGTRSSAVRR